MSSKRQATTDLNHENWDQEDPSEHEEMGSFRPASKDVLEKRVIRTAKRRSQASGNEPKKSVFSGFGGFNKAPPSSFDFLANLTNGNKSTNGSPAAKSDTVTSSLFGSKVASSGAMFNMPASSSPTTKSTFGSPSHTSSLFGGSLTTTGQSLFTASKADSTVADSPFKIQATSSSSDTKDSKTTNVSISQVSSTMFGIPSTNTNKSLFSASNSTFKIPPVSSNSTVQTSFSNTTKSASNESDSKTEDDSDDKKMLYYCKLKGLNESVSDWIKKHVEETPLCILSPIFKDYEIYLKEIQEEYHGNKDDTVKKPSKNTITDTKPSPAGTTNTIADFDGANSGVSFFSNESNTTLKSPATVPTQEKTSGFSFGIKPSTTNSSSTSDTKPSPAGTTNTIGGFAGANSGVSLFSNERDTTLKSPATVPTQEKKSGFSFGIKPSTTNSSCTSTSDSKPSPAGTTNTIAGFAGVNSGVSLFSIERDTTLKSPATLPTQEKTSGFSFGIKPSTTNTSSTSTSPSSGGFSFGIKTSPPEKAATTSSQFSLATNTNGAAPFSFGIGKPFSFSANVEKPVEQTEEANQDEPPKVEFTPVIEENCVFEKRCKIFVKKDGNFADKGVGTLYIKKIEESGKHQLLVRANTNLGNVLLNLILTSSIPTQRLGKNNVMLVCIPTPDAKPPPTPVLIRVKTSDEADDLLAILNKFKV